MADVSIIYEIINDSAEAYREVIPKDLWNEPYMSLTYLNSEIEAGVVFFGLTGGGGRLLGVMGIQDKKDVFLIRHAYVRTTSRRQGIGAQLLTHLTRNFDKPLLVGTWKAAHWAISFYEKYGFEDVGPAETARMLKTYWSISARQVETSIVLADGRWRNWHETVQDHAKYIV